MKKQHNAFLFTKKTLCCNSYFLFNKFLVEFGFSGIKLVISAVKSKKIFVASSLDNFSFFKNHYGVGVSYR